MSHCNGILVYDNSPETSGRTFEITDIRTKFSEMKIVAFNERIKFGYVIRKSVGPNTHTKHHLIFE